MTPHERTRRVMVGNVAVGGGAPVSVQSMCNTKTTNAEATLAQIGRFAEAGCEIARVTVPTKDAVEPFRRICAESPLPIVADIHFDYRLAIAAIEAGASAVRVNPGNIGSFDRVDAVIDAAGEKGCAIRIGVNAGSLAKEYDERQDLTLPEKLVASAESFVAHFEDRGFTDFVLSAKVHGVNETVEVNRRLSEALPQVPLHIGVTEAGTARQGTVKSSIALIPRHTSAPPRTRELSDLRPHPGGPHRYRRGGRAPAPDRQGTHYRRGYGVRCQWTGRGIGG